MRWWHGALRAGWCAGLLAACSALAQLPPAEVFYGPPDIESAALSPSGRWLAMTTGVGGSRVGLAVFDLKEWKPHAMVARYGDADINEFHWVNDQRLIYDVVDRTRGSGEQRWWPGLFAVDRDGKGTQQLVKLDRPFIVGERRTGREPLDPWHVLLHVPAGGGDEVIVGEVEHDAGGDFRAIKAKRLNVENGRTRNLSMGVPDDVWWWSFDTAGEPRLVLTRRQGQQALYTREPGGSEWKKLAEWAVFKAPFTPRFFDRDGNLYVTTVEGRDGTRVLKRFNFATGQPDKEPLVRTPGFDFEGGLVVENRGDRALGVRVTTDAETTVWFDPKMAALQKEADQRFPGRINRLNCRRCDAEDRITLLFSYSDQDPGQYWVHLAASGEWRKLGDKRPKVEPRRMAITDFARIKARDGLEIPVWITKPATGAGPRPAVVLVHGGPWVRGRHWQWDDDAQFLASRGYVVIEPEFRGSTGYGQRLFRAGFKQWGQAMQDDLADALGWAVKQGHADPKRVCIAGASYGGYATLMGLVRHGDLFRCGVAWVGVTDPRLMFRWRADYDVIGEHREYSYPVTVGDPVADKEMLDANTPVLLADRIKSPLLLVYGSEDRRVPLVHGTRMRDALAAAGNPPEWVLYAGEGHGWLKLETRLDFARRVEQFLAKHLAP